MTFPPNPKDRLPRSDENGHLSLGMGREETAVTAGIPIEQPCTIEGYQAFEPVLNSANLDRVYSKAQELCRFIGHELRLNPQAVWQAFADGCAICGFELGKIDSPEFIRLWLRIILDRDEKTAG